MNFRSLTAKLFKGRPASSPHLVSGPTRGSMSLVLDLLRFNSVASQSSQLLYEKIIFNTLYDTDAVDADADNVDQDMLIKLTMTMVMMIMMIKMMIMVNG